MKKPINLLIPAAGKGSRFSGIGINTPKPLIPVWEVPMLMWVLANFPLQPQDKVVILSQKKHELPQGLRPFSAHVGFEISYIEIDYWTEGPAHSLELLLQNSDEELPIICANSDQYIFEGLKEFTDAVRHGKSHGQILTMEASSNAWSYVGRAQNGKVNRVVEKQEISNEATVGVYGWASSKLCAEALSWQRIINQRVNDEFYVAPAYHNLIERGLEISTHSAGIHGESVHGLGTPKDLENFLRHPQASRARDLVIERLGLK